jgi:hypothetical protein
LTGTGTYATSERRVMRAAISAAAALLALTGCELPGSTPRQSAAASAYAPYALPPIEALIVKVGMRAALVQHPNAAAAGLSPDQSGAQFTKLAASRPRGAAAGAPVTVCGRVLPERSDGSFVHDYLFMGELVNGQFTPTYSAGLASDSWDPLATLCRQRGISP